MQRLTTTDINPLITTYSPPNFLNHLFSFNLIESASLTHITFGYHFSHSSSPPPLTHLTFGFNFLPIDLTTSVSSLSHLTLDFNDATSVNFLLTDLIHSNCTYHSNDNLPSTLTLANFTPHKKNSLNNNNNNNNSNKLMLLMMLHFKLYLVKWVKQKWMLFLKN